MVAPHAGAWIETKTAVLMKEPREVAPHAGAWIETIKAKRVLLSCPWSPPTRGRGLKHQ